MITLPPLPEMAYHSDINASYGYTADQLRAYGDACTKAALEAAARVAEKHFHSTTAKQIRALEVSHDPAA